MMLQEGKKAYGFCLKDKDEKEHCLKDVKSDYTVLFFYPKDNTSGCTIESKDFSKNLEKFQKLNTTVIGISGGDQKSKEKFCSKNNLKQPMLSDTDFKVSEKYGVYGEKKFMGNTYMGISRVTFVLDKNKKVIKVFEKVKPLGHAKEVLEVIENDRNN
jgi:peroxiredoxin Q/BCP